MKRRQARARAGEWLAAIYLVWHGYRVIARNWYSRSGELDIVAYKSRTLVIVEIKTRFKNAVLDDLIDHDKRAALERTAQEFKKYYRRRLRGLRISKLRFDLIVIKHSGGVFKYWIAEHQENCL